jgi:microcystin-dependent protein
MPQPFLSEIKIVSFNYAPRGWALCNGQFLPINQNQALFSLLGTRYGGNGQTTFALPNLRGQVPIHTGNGHTLGEQAGSTSVTINIQQLPTHLHQWQGVAANGTSTTPNGNLYAKASTNLYNAAQNLQAFSPDIEDPVGGSQPHNNMAPYLTVSFIICLSGIFPSQS